MTKKERRDVKEVFDLLIRCDRVIHNLIKTKELTDPDIILDLKVSGITDMRMKLDNERNKHEH